VKKSWLKLLLLFSALPLVISTIYLNSQALDWDHNQRALEVLRNIELLDALSNQEVLKVRYSMYADYDALSDYANQFRQEARGLPQQSGLSHTHDLRNQAVYLQTHLLQKAELIEQFKTQNALLKNALINFPALANEAKSSLKTGNFGQSPSVFLDTLIRDVMMFSLINDHQVDAGMRARIDNIVAWQNRNSGASDASVNDFMRSTRFIIQKRNQVSASTEELMNIPVSRTTQKMQASLLGEYDTVLSQSNTYKTLLYGLSIALLAYTAFILSKLRINSRELSREKDRALVTLQSIADGVITTDSEGLVQFINPVGEKLTGWLTEEARGKPLSDVFKLHDHVTEHPIEGLVERCISENRQISSSEANTLYSRDGRSTHVQESVSPIKSEDEQITGTITVFRDVSHTLELSRKLAYQASHDSLTGVINRRAFDRRLQQAITSAKLNGLQHSLLYLDLDQFKIVNDTCGHDAGDHLLIEVTTMLKQKLRDKDTLARLGGDEFGILLDTCQLECAETFAKEILHEFKQFRFTWQGIHFQLGTSIGIVQIHKDTESIVSLLSAADMACYVSKDMGRNRFHVFHNKDKELMRRHGEMQWVSRLTHAFKEGRFILYRQPVMPLTPQITTHKHYELLIRLRDGNNGLVLPGAFIPAAERYNFMPVLDRWVIRTAFEQCFQFPNNDRYAINLSGTSLNSDSLLQFIKREMRRTPVTPQNICFEITETAAIDNLLKAAKLIKELKQYGFKFALDDFGKGLSSYSYLSNLPVDYLKIDGEFVKKLSTDPVNYEIIKSVNHIGHLMGMKTIAECVENEKTLRDLRKIGIDYGQGSSIGEPQPLFVNWTLSDSQNYLQKSRV
jgi:diguanylate cyclase (GGDEF)-like protein/PAS domain S-box-containing protein